MRRPIGLSTIGGFFSNRRFRHALLLAISLSVTCLGCVTVPQTNEVENRSVRKPEVEPQTRQGWLSLERQLEAALLAEPDDPSGWSTLAAVYHRNDRNAAARDAYERCLLLDPYRSPDRLAYARLLLESGQDRAAWRQVTQLIRQFPDHPEALAIRGQALRRLGRNDEARADLEAAWSSQKPSIHAGFELAEWEWTRGEHKSSVDRLRLCAAYEPEEPRIRRLLAERLETVGEPREAIDHWEWLVDRGEGGAEAYRRLAHLRTHVGETVAARRDLESARRLAPEDPAAARLERKIESLVPRIAPSVYRPLPGT